MLSAHHIFILGNSRHRVKAVVRAGHGIPAAVFRGQQISVLRRGRVPDQRLRAHLHALHRAERIVHEMIAAGGTLDEFLKRTGVVSVFHRRATAGHPFQPVVVRVGRTSIYLGTARLPTANLQPVSADNQQTPCDI